jgi:MarR family transcriptional regulator, transcriptional regulator for hemolysin
MSGRFAEYRHGAGFLLARLGAMAERDWNVHLKSVGLVQSEFTVLVVLSSGESLRQSDVAERAGVDPRNLVPVVARLSARGLVESRESPSDGRVKLLRISNAGVRQLSLLDAEVTPAGKEFFGALSSEEYTALCDLLDRVYAARLQRDRPL